MPRIETTEHGHTTLYLSADDTEAWAIRPGRKWPCSRLAGKHLKVTFDHDGDEVSRVIRAREGHVIDPWVPTDEFVAMTSDHLPAGHPAKRSFGE